MTPKRNMSAEEGWRNLRQQLPSLNRAYMRQRTTRLVIYGLLAVGAASAVFAFIQMRPDPAILPVPAKPEPLSKKAVTSASVRPSAETAPDAPEHVEALGTPNQR